MGKKISAQDDDTYFQGIIHENLEFIEKKCFKAVQMQLNKYSSPKTPHINLENEALELSNQILDKLKENNYKVLRQFKRKSKLSTYLTVIIANQIVDSIRKKRGRSREKERAKPFGQLGTEIVQRILIEGCSSEQLYQELKRQKNLHYSKPEFETIIEKIKGNPLKSIRHIPDENNPFLLKGYQNHETGELIVSDTKNNPEENTIKNQKQQKIHETLHFIIGQLNGEERLILRLRFPIHEGEVPQEINTISRILAISKKAVYKRISRVLKKCQHILIQKGFNINDLL